MSLRAFVIAKVILVNPEGKILAVRRSKTDTRRPLQWDFPGGFVEADEDPRTAVIREAREEAGTTCVDPVLVFGMSEYLPDRGGAGTWLTFIDFLKDTPEVNLSFEHDRYTWIKPELLLKELTYDRQKKMLEYCVQNGFLSR